MNKNSNPKNQNLKFYIIDKILFYLYAALFLITPLLMLPFTSELFEFNKMIFIYLLATLILFFWILKMISFKKIIIKKTPFDIAIILFFISQVLSTLFSIDRHTSIFGYYSRFNGGLLSIIAYIILFYGFASNLSFDTKILEILLKISLFSSLMVIFWGLPGKFGHDLTCLLFMGQFNNSCWTDQFRPAERMFSTLGQPNWLGAYLAINFFIGMYFFYLSIKNKKLIHSLFYFFIVNLTFIGIIFTKSRSAFLAVIVEVGVSAAVVFLKWLREKNKRVFYLLTIVLVINSVFLATIFTKKQLNNRAKKQTSSVTESFDIRKIVWKGAIDLGLRYPLFGTGVETFAYSYYFVRPKEHNLTSEWDYLYNKAHNEYLNYFATTGVIGLGSYIVLIGTVCFYILKKLKIKNEKLKMTIKNLKLKNSQAIQIINNNNETILIICLFLAYISILITNFFGFSTTTVNLFFYLIPAFLVVSNNITIEQSTNKLSLFQKLNIVILILATCYLIFAIFKYWYADILYAKADQRNKLGDYQTSANFLNQALKLKYEHVYEDKLSYTLANLAVLAAYQKQSEVAKKLMNLSKFYNQKAINNSPKNVLYWKTKAKNHYLFYQISLSKGELEEGIRALIQGKNLSPTDPKIPYSLAIFYSLMIDEVKKKEEKLNFQNLSVRMVDESISLKPNYRDGYFLKGQLFKKYGQKEEAKKIFQFILKKINPLDEEVKKELHSI
ncbi:MAG: O-antigen ligase family protein [Microgenomates group bacterium]